MRRLLVSALAIVGASAAARPALAQPIGATEYTFRLTSAETDPKGRRTVAPPFVGRVQAADAAVPGAPIAGAAVRVDILAGREGYATGDYLLLDAEGTRAVVVSPARRSWREVAVTDVPREIARKARIAVAAPRVSVDTLGAGAPEAGEPAGALRRVRVERACSLQVKVLFMSQRSHALEQTEYWTSDAARDLPNPLLWFFTGMNRALTAGDSTLARRTREAERALTRGVVRTRTRVVLDGGGTRQLSEAETRVTDVRRIALAPDAFVLPAGYRRTDR